jgi:hypothetical protein
MTQNPNPDMHPTNQNNLEVTHSTFPSSHPPHKKLLHIAHALRAKVAHGDCRHVHQMKCDYVLANREAPESHTLMCVLPQSPDTNAT